MLPMKILVILCAALMFWNVDAEEAAVEKDWIDPTDMIYYDPIKKSMRNQNKASGMAEEVDTSKSDESDAILEAKCSKFCSTDSNCESETAHLLAELASSNATVNELGKKVVRCERLRDQEFFRQYIKVLLERFKNLAVTDDHHYDVQIKLTTEQYGYLYNYTVNEQGSVQEVHSILVSMHQNVRRSDKVLFEAEDGELWSNLSQYLLIGVQILCGISSSLLVCIRCPRSLWWIATRLSLVLFIVSVGFTWWHLYKKEYAAYRARMMKTLPESCLTESTSLLSLVSLYFSFESDQCAQFYEDQEINPIFLVPPTKAIVAAITIVVLEPAEHIGKALNRLTVATFRDLPFYLWIPVSAILVLLFVLSAFFGSGYRLRTLLFNIEPHRDGGDGLESSQRFRELEAENSRQSQELTRLRDDLRRVQEIEDRSKSQNSCQREDILQLLQLVQNESAAAIRNQHSSIVSAGALGEGDHLTTDTEAMEAFSYPMVCSETPEELVDLRDTQSQLANPVTETETLGATELTVSTTMFVQSTETDFEIIDT